MCRSRAMLNEMQHSHACRACVKYRVFVVILYAILNRKGTQAQRSNAAQASPHVLVAAQHRHDVAMSAGVDCHQPSRSEKHHAACRWRPVKTVHQVQIHMDQCFCESQHSATQCLGRAKCSVHFVLPKH